MDYHCVHIFSFQEGTENALGILKPAAILLAASLLRLLIQLLPSRRVENPPAKLQGLAKHCESLLQSRIFPSPSPHIPKSQL